MIKVTGHINPDTDTVCSPIVYSWYINNHKGMESIPVIAGEMNNETKFILEYFKVNTPEIIKNFSEGDKIIILDTNNPEELLEGIDKAEILEIVDHHKLFGGLKTESPININMKPVGCTATLVWEMVKEKTTDIPKEMAGLLLACILSDTLKFKSPTTTDADKNAVEELQKIAEVNVDEFAEKMFEAKSDLGDATAADILLIDSKKVTMNGKDVRVSVLETTKPAVSLAMRSEIEAAIEKMMGDEKLDGLFFFVVDIIEQNAKAFAGNAHNKEILEKTFKGKIDADNIMDLPGVVSRKKQIIPELERVYSEA